MSGGRALLLFTQAVSRQALLAHQPASCLHPPLTSLWDIDPIIYDSGIHPADVITRSSDPELLQIARNTIWTDGKNVKWNPTNGSPSKM